MPCNNKDWRLTTTSEADLPQVLSTGTTEGSIVDVDISDDYLAFVVNSSGRKVFIYDISNVYAPELINIFTNEEGLLLDDINIMGDILMASNGNNLFSAYVRGQNIETKRHFSYLFTSDQNSFPQLFWHMNLIFPLFINSLMPSHCAVVKCTKTAAEDEGIRMVHYDLKVSTYYSHSHIVFIFEIWLFL